VTSGRLRLATALTVVSSLVTPMAFPHLGFEPLAWFGVAPFLLALRLSSAREAAWLGVVWTLGFSISVGHWLPSGLSFYFEHGSPFGWITFLSVIAVMVVPYVVLFAVLYVRLAAARRGAALPFAAAAAWVVCEWARVSLMSMGGIFASLPWALMGYSQVDVEPLVQIASVTGVYGVSFVLLVINATISDFALDGWRGTLTGRNIALRSSAASVLVLAVWLQGTLSLRDAPAPGGEPDGTVVAVVQGHIGLGERWHRHFHGRNLNHYLNLTKDIVEASGAQLVVWPEAAMTFFLEQEPQYQAPIRSLLQPRDVELISGIPRQGEQPDEYFNSVYLLSPEVEVIGRYDKEYLIPFAEYIPFAKSKLLEDLFGRFREFSLGSNTGPIETRAGMAGIMICNEAVLPSVARSRVLAGATYLVNPSNDSWARHPNFTGQWFDIVRFRAIEQSRYLVRASTSGPSGIIDPWGRSIKTTERFERGATSGRIVPRSELSIYARVGDLFSLLCLLGLLAGLFAGRGQRSA
jgi:apolipoprotein N-acyltransferase